MNILSRGMLITFLSLLSFCVFAQNSTIICSDIEERAMNAHAKGLATLMLLKSAECLGGNNDEDPLASVILEKIKLRDLLASDYSQISIEAFQVMLDELDLYLPQIVQSQANKVLLSTVEQVKLDGSRTKELLSNFIWEVVDGRIAALDYDFNQELVDICNNENETQLCSDKYLEAKSVLRYSNLVDTIIFFNSRPVLEGLAGLYSKRVAMWDDYVKVALPQWPWEYYATSKLNGDNRPVVDGNPQGPRELPKWQARLGHFSTGLSMLDQQDNGSLQPSIYVEILGVNRLFWDYEKGRLNGGIGASLVAAFDNNANDNVSFGVMFHLDNKYSLAILDNDGDTGILASVDLVNYFQDSWAYKAISKQDGLLDGLFKK